MKALAVTLILTGTALAIPGLLIGGIGFTLEAYADVRRARR